MIFTITDKAGISENVGDVTCAIMFDDYLYGEE